MTIYVVDTNFFIQAHRLNYPFDVVTSFWNKVKKLAAEGKIISIDKVKKEIYGDKESEKDDETDKTVNKDDELTIWCKNNLPKDFFKDTSVLSKYYEQVVNWTLTKKGHYLPKAISEFLEADEADAWLVTYALEDKANRIIVTQEISNPQKRNEIKIPDVCNDFDIKYVNTIGLFRQLGESF
jgi:hypothetical protein